tara:strand:- start:86 stop:736 length:651 start_codon:yes stop_codon:yes gene_type:complete
MTKQDPKNLDDLVQAAKAFATNDYKKSLTLSQKSRILILSEFGVAQEKGKFVSEIVSWDKVQKHPLDKFMIYLNHINTVVIKALGSKNPRAQAARQNTMNTIIQALNKHVKIAGVARLSVKPINRPMWSDVSEEKDSYIYQFEAIPVKDPKKPTANAKESTTSTGRNVQPAPTATASALEHLVSDDPKTILSQLVKVHGFDLIALELSKLGLRKAS